MLKGSSSTRPAAAAAAAVVVGPSRRRILKAMQALPLQALRLTYEVGPFATYNVPAWASGRLSRVVISSVGGLIITVTDGEGGALNAKQGAREGQRPGHVAHDGGRSFCATATSTRLSMVLI